MAKNRGKEFENVFKSDFKRTFSDCIDRLYDQVSGYRTIANISDFIAYKYPNLYYLECKSHLGNVFPFDNLTQYDSLKVKVGIQGVRAGVVLWMIEHDVVVYIPISTITKMKEDGKKSFNVKMLETKEYNIIEIPSVKLRTYMKSDYSCLMNLKEGE